MQQKPIFRQAALERLSSPEQLDQLMPIIALRGWIALFTVIGLVLLALAWSFFDTIPTQVTGRGILIRGGQLLPVVAPVGGQIEALFVQAGDLVQPGQIIASLQPLDNAGAAPVQAVSLFTGQVVELAAARGSVVNAGETIATLEDPAKPLEAVIYVPASTGKSVQPGMAAQVSLANVGYEAYGFLRGTVRSVALFPSTAQSMLTVLANEQLVNEFMAEGTPLEVRIELIPDSTTASGYAWSSASGPPLAVNSGTLGAAIITVSERRLIELLIPGR